MSKKLIRAILPLLLLYACHSSIDNSSPQEPKSPLFNRVPLNIDDGYTVNSASNDSVKPIINSLGDSLITGKSLPISPKIIPAQQEEERQYQTLGEPETIQISNFKGLSSTSNYSESIIDRSSLNEVTLGAGKKGLPVVNLKSDTLISGIKSKLKATVSPLVYKQSKRVSNPQFKEDVESNIRYLNVDHGLTSSYIYSIIEDDLGRFWLGTYGNGLMIYDGKSIQSIGLKEGLSSSLIRKLFKDSKGNIWIGHEAGGLTKFDGLNFHNYSQENGFFGKNVYDILEDKNGDIWVATEQGMSQFNGKEFIQFTQKEGLSSRIVWSICEDSKGRIWIGHDDGVVSCFNGKKFVEYGEEQGILAGSILDITEDSEGNIWVSSMGNGVYRLSGNTITHFSKNEGLMGRVITSITEDDNNTIWFTSFGDGIFNYSGNNFQHFTEQQGLSASNFWMMYQDNSGSLWFGSEGGGISILDNQSFHHLNVSNGLKSNITWALEDASGGGLWMSSLGAGIAHKQNGSFNYYSTDQNLSSNNVLAILSDSKDNLWLGTWGNGVDYISDHQVYNFNTENGLGSNHVFSIIEDNSGAIWFSTASAGAIKFDGDQFYQFSEAEGLGAKNVRSTFEDSKGNVWFATDGAGISKYDGQKITHFTEREGLSSNYVRCIEEDQFGNIWIGTNLGGISIFTGKDFIQITEERGLTNNSIRTIDRTAGNLFVIGTEKGLNLLRLSQNSKKEFVLELSTRQKQDGLKSIDFLLNTSLIDENQKMWWSMGKTLTSIDIKELSIANTTPKVLISNLEINEQSYDFAKKNDSISFQGKKDFLNIPEEAIFKHHQNHLTFHFSGIDWKAPHALQYSYRINNEAWSRSSEEAKADYRNLAPGSYSFEVRAKGRNNKWSKIQKLQFEILSPWWKTWWAYVLYTLLIGAFIFAAYRFQLKRKIALNEAKRLTEMDRMKTEFFTNISHEFRTPLTIITGLKDRLTKNYEEQKNQAFSKNVEVLHKNSDQLLSLVNQLLDISKLEHGTLNLDIEPLDVYSICKYELSSYGSTADQKNIQLELNSEKTNLSILADEKAFLSVFHNLLGNALKFTSNGKITVKLTAENNSTIQIAISDTGIGIPHSELPKIFDRFYQVDNSATKEFQGTGIGLSHVKTMVELQNATINVNSELDKGSTFILKFPRGVDLRNDENDLSQNEITETPKLREIDETDTRPKLLIVEDNEDMRYFISLVLEEEYSITTANDGEEGLKIAQELVPDFIISDWMMPKMTGPELLQRLKENVSTSHIPMMLLTARADQKSKIKGYKHGADAYLTKPFESEELSVRIKVLIDAQQRLQRFYSTIENTNLPESPERPKIEDAFILKTLEFIQENLGNSELSGDKIANQHHLSRSQFARKLRTLTGKSVTEFIRNQRLTEAKKLLNDGKLNISEIAYEVGFSDPAYFTRVFTKEFNVPPTDWKKSN